MADLQNENLWLLLLFDFFFKGGREGYLCKTYNSYITGVKTVSLFIFHWQNLYGMQFSQLYTKYVVYQT